MFDSAAAQALAKQLNDTAFKEKHVHSDEWVATVAAFNKIIQEVRFRSYGQEQKVGWLPSTLERVKDVIRRKQQAGCCDVTTIQALSDCVDADDIRDLPRLGDDAPTTICFPRPDEVGDDARDPAAAYLYQVLHVKPEWLRNGEFVAAFINACAQRPKPPRRSWVEYWIPFSILSAEQEHLAHIDAVAGTGAADALDSASPPDSKDSAYLSPFEAITNNSL